MSTVQVTGASCPLTVLAASSTPVTACLSSWLDLLRAAGVEVEVVHDTFGVDD